MPPACSALAGKQKPGRLANAEAIIFSHEYVKQVEQLAAAAACDSPAVAAWTRQLLALTSLAGNNYAVVDALKALCTGFVRLAAAADAITGMETAQAGGRRGEHSLRRPLQLLVGLMFVLGSRPFHRQLISCLRPLLRQQGEQREGPTLPAAVADGVAGAAAAVLDGRQRQRQQAAADALLLASAVEAALSQPALGEALQPHAAAIVAAVGWGLGATLAAAPGSVAAASFAAGAPAAGAAAAPDAPAIDGAAGTGSSRCTPAEAAAVPMARAVADGIQDAVAVLYTLLSTCGPSLLSPQPPVGEGAGTQHGGAAQDAAQDAVVAAGSALLLALQGSALPREVLSSAAVALHAAAVLPTAPPATMAACLAHGLGLCSAAVQGNALTDAAAPTAAASGQPLGVLDAHLRARGSSLAAELARLPALSRVCALRGLLAALPPDVLCAPLAPTGAVGAVGAEPAGGGKWLLLRDGALPAICTAIQAAPDAHFRFHAMSALAVCVDRCRQLVHQAAGAASLGAPQAANGRYAHSAREAQQQLLEQQDGSQEPAGETLVGRAATASSSWPPGLPPPTLGPAHCQLLLGVLWPGWEDPLAQTVQRVHEAFAALLDCLEAQRCLGRAAAESSGDAGSGAGGESEFLLSLAKQLLALEPGRKGRYAPLAAVAAHLGAARLLTLRPGLVHEAVAAAADATVAHSVSGLVAVLWQRRREELHAERGRRSGGAAGDAAGDAAAAAEAEAAWRAWCLPPLIAALASPSERQRFGAATYLLPALLQEEPAMLPALLRALLDAEGAPAAGAGAGAGAGGRGAGGCLAVLKAGRRLGLVTDLGSLGPAGIAPAQLEALLRQAAAHPSEALRVDALQLICCHPRSTAPPTALELSVASRALALALRTSSGGLRSKASQALVRLLQRMRGGAALALNPASGGGGAAGAAGGGSPAALPPEVAAAEAWLRDLSGRLVLSLYPGAPYQRTYMAIQLLNLLLDTWGDCLNPVLPPCVAKDGSGRMPPGALHPFSPLLASAGAVRCLLAAALDSWDKLREAAAAVLLRLPSPLPGLESAAELRPVMAWVLALLDAPRCREADAGARLLHLLACKYVAQSGWQLSLADGTVAPPAAPPEAGQGAGDAALLATLASGCELVEARLAAARADLLGACRRGLAAGPLLALRLLAEAVPWGRLGAGAAAGAAAAEREEAAAAASEARALVARMLELCWQVAEVALPTLSRPQDENVSAEEVDAEDVPTYSDNDGEDGMAEDKEGDGAEDLGPRAQVISTGCWISMRESCLLLGTLAQLLPITGKGALLAQGQLQEMGDHLLRLLLAMKHYGAVDRAALALLALAGRLAAAPPPALAAMPRAWLAAALAFLARPGQGRSDIVRRSAGLPYALTALFEAEPEQHHRRLLAAGMHALLAVARGGGAADAGDAAALPCDGAGADAPGAAGGDPWPRVHAFNCLRMAFQSAVLAVDVSAYVAPGVEACILGLAAPQWEVRNAAMLCYTALPVRTLGFRNLAHVKDARKGLSAADFFHRFPQLHAFLLQQLRAATEQLESGGARGGGGGARVHPSLFPVLALLSRLFPSHRSRLSGSGGASGGADSANSPEAFAALVQRCGAAAPAAVRRLAAEALPPLLPQEDQAAAAAGLAAAVAAAVARQQCQKRQRQQRQGQQQQGGESRTSLNALHGRLLQLRALLVAGAGGGPGGSVLLAAVAPALHEAAWACELESYPCAAVSFEYVRAAAVAADLPGALAHPEAAAWLGAVQQRCWAAIEGSVEAAAPDSANPMLSVAFKAAAQLHFSLLLRQCDAQESGASGSSSGGSGGGGEAPARRLLSQLAVALRSRRYEVRGAALKALLKHMRNWQGRRQQEQTQAQHAQQQQARVADLGLGSGGTLGELWQLLNAQLEQQGHHKAQRRLLALLALLPAAAPPDGAAGATAAGTAAASGAGLLAHLLRRAHSAADPAARRHAIECLGPQLGALLAGAGEGAAASASALEAVQQVLGAVGEASQPHQLPELRLAAVRALHASDLLRLAPLQPPGREPAASGSAADEDQWSEAAVAAWAAAVALLEDDDGGVRDAAAATVAGAAAAAEGGACAAASQQQEQQQLGWEAAGALAFELMPARFGPCPALLARLCAWCCPAAAGAQAGADAAAAAEAAAGVGASRIFDREEDNQHQEPLMVSQLAAAALAKMLASLPGSADGQSTGGAALALQPAAADLLAAWLRCALAALATLLPAAARGSGGAARPAGVGGGGSRGAARFRMLCQAWLAVWAAGHCPAALAPARPCATGSAGMSLDRERVLALIEPLAQASGREWEGQPQLAAASAAAVARWRFGGGALPADPAATFLL